MKSQRHIKRVALAAAAVMCLSACKTVAFPKIDDIMKSTEFSEDVDKIGEDYPDIEDAPFVPTDIRSDKQWDKDARSLQRLRDGTDRISLEAGLTAAEADREYENLKAKAQAYKKDDPASGPVQQPIPNYKPRR